MNKVGLKTAKVKFIIETTQQAGSKLIEEVWNLFRNRENMSSLKLHIKIADTKICIHVASQAMWDLIYPALAWLAEPSEFIPEIEIFALDGAGVIESPWNVENFLDGNRISGLANGKILGSFDIEYSILSLFDRSTSRGLFWVQSLSELPEWEFGAPLRKIFEWALLDKGLQVIHSAAIGLGNQGVLLCGPGGSGKSTTTALCLSSNFVTTGDDYCAISVGSPHKVYGIFGLLKLVPGSIGAKSLANLTWTQERSDGKVHYKIEDKMVRSLSINAIVFPRVYESTQELKQIAPKETLLRLLSSTLNQTTNPQAELFESLGSLSRSIKAFELNVGPDFDSAKEYLGKLCRE
jgi:hypothetical protein